MEIRKTILVITVSCMILSGCTYDLFVVRSGSKKKPETPKMTNHTSSKINRAKVQDYDMISFQNPIILTHTDIEKKKIYILTAKETLKLFRLIADDTLRRGKTLSLDELGREAHKYMEMYVKPLINDSEAYENSETKIEIAKLHVLGAFLYFDIGGYNKVRQYLDLIHTRYGKDSYLLGITINQKDIGFTTLADGIKELQTKLSVQTKG